MPTFRFPAFLIACLFALLAFSPAHAGDPLPVEKAFVVHAQALGADAVEVVFEIAPGYYLYGERFAFSTKSENVRLGKPELPPGTRKLDPILEEEIETYRGQLRIRVPFTASVERFTLEVKSQGCWDGGVCYPPNTYRTEIDVVQGKTSSHENSGGDESGRLASMLSSSSTLPSLAIFFGLGLLLAFTPCVFPMIPILSSLIIGAGNVATPKRALVLSSTYVFGMALVYALLGVVAGLTGSLFSAALQNTWVLLTISALFVLLALSMFGFFELRLPTSWQGRLAQAANREKGGHLGGVLVMGAVSALIISPCVSAPLAGALTYIAQTGNAALGGLALFVFALGMGIPLVIVAASARSLLPRAGSWMVGVQRAAGVMLLAVALWVSSSVLPAWGVMLGWAALLLFSGVFLSALDPLPAEAPAWRRFWKGWGVLLLITGATILIGTLAGSRDPLQPLAVFQTRAPSSSPVFENIQSEAELDARLQTADRPVMLDFYADWCVSCKEMERDTFTDPAVLARMAQMKLIRVDVTDNTNSHKALLARFGLVGPPGIVFFGADGQLRQDVRAVGFMDAAAFAALLDRVLSVHSPLL